VEGGEAGTGRRKMEKDEERDVSSGSERSIGSSIFG